MAVDGHDGSDLVPALEGAAGCLEVLFLPCMITPAGYVFTLGILYACDSKPWLLQLFVFTIVVTIKTRKPSCVHRPPCSKSLVGGGEIGTSLYPQSGPGQGAETLGGSYLGIPPPLDQDLVRGVGILGYLLPPSGPGQGGRYLGWGGGGRYLGPGQGRYPPLPHCGQTDGQTRVKTLPSRRTTYAGGNNSQYFITPNQK